jgi:hypothetical protein
METSDREKRDRIYAHAFAQVWLDDFRMAASRGALQVPYDELVEKALELVSDIRQIKRPWVNWMNCRLRNGRLPRNTLMTVVWAGVC